MTPEDVLLEAMNVAARGNDSPEVRAILTAKLRATILTNLNEYIWATSGNGNIVYVTSDN